MKIRKILITNIVSLNIGDAAILWGTMEILRHKYGSNVEITVFDKVADIAQQYYPWANFRPALFSRPVENWLGRILERKGYGHWNNRFKFMRFILAVLTIRYHLPVIAQCLTTQSEFNGLQEYTSADLILSSGGTYLIENYDLSSAILDYYLSITTGKPFGFFTQTLGPFKRSRNCRAFRRIFSHASVILLRDKRSKNHILELGIEPKNIHLAADAAFVLARNATKLDSVYRKSTEFPRLAISVRSMSFFQEQGSQGNLISYYEAMALAAIVAIEKFGAKVTFLSTCQGVPEYWTNDADTAEEIYALLPEKIRQHAEVDRQFRQPDEVVDVYRTYDAVIATRMHAAILSMCAGTPILGIAYEFKMEELFKNIGMSELVLSVDSLSEGDVKDRVHRLLSQHKILRSRVKIAAEKKYDEAWLAEGALPVISARNGR